MVRVVLLFEVEQDGRSLKDGEIAIVWVDDGRDTAWYDKERAKSEVRPGLYFCYDLGLTIGV